MGIKIEIEASTPQELQVWLERIWLSLGETSNKQAREILDARAVEEAVEQHITAPQKRKRRTKAQIEADKAAKAAQAAEPEPSNVTPIAPADPEPADPEPAPDESAAHEAREAFKRLVTEDYGKAAEVLSTLGCESFNDVVEGDKIADLMAALA